MIITFEERDKQVAVVLEREAVLEFIDLVSARLLDAPRILRLVDDRP